jgi:branched-chain amino acid transport system ATP-binding protein
VLLEVDQLTTRFGSLIAVDHVSFSLDRGQILGLIGPNGAGKTTLFNTVAGFIRPSAGSVNFQGTNITSMAPHAIARRGLARTFQLSRPFGELSVMDNVLVGAWLKSPNRRAAHATAERALERVNFTHRAHVRAQDLTVAERKRLDLARCLATEPVLLLVDEVIAGCTDLEMDEILKTLGELSAHGLSVIMVEHVLRAVMAVCNRILVLASGAVVVEGTPAEVRSHPRAIEVYLGAEVEDEDGSEIANLRPRATK